MGPTAHVPRLRPTIWGDVEWESLCAQHADAVILLLDARTLAIDDASFTVAAHWGAPPEAFRQLRFSCLVYPRETVGVLHALRAAGAHDGARAQATFWMVVNQPEFIAVSAVACGVTGVLPKAAAPRAGGGSDRYAGGYFGVGRGSSDGEERLVRGHGRDWDGDADGGCDALLVTVLPRTAGMPGRLATGAMSALLAPAFGSVPEASEITHEERTQGFFRAHLSSSGMFQFCSPVCLDVLGYSAVELLRQRLQNIVAPYFVAALVQRLQQAAATPEHTIELTAPIVTRCGPARALPASTSAGR